MLRSIDREFFDLVASSETNKKLNDVLENKGIKRMISSDSNTMLKELLDNDFKSSTVKEFKNKILDKSKNDLISDLELIHETLNLDSSVHKDAIYAIGYFGIKRFKDAVIYLLTLVDYSNICQELVTLKTAIVNCHGLGFYTEAVCDIIEEDLINTKKIQLHDLYHRALEIRH